MDAALEKALKQRAEYLTEARAIYLEERAAMRIAVKTDWWQRPKAKARWEMLHAAADACIRRYFEAINSPF